MFFATIEGFSTPTALPKMSPSQYDTRINISYEFHAQSAYCFKGHQYVLVLRSLID